MTASPAMSEGLLSQRVTPDWLTSVLRQAGEIRAATVVDWSAEPCGDGLAADTFRVRPIYDDDEAGAPRTFVAKLTSSSGRSRKFARGQGLYAREVLFYRHLAPDLAVSTPRVLRAELEPGDGTNFLILMEDLWPAAECDQICGCSVDQAALALEQAAALHGSSWNRPDLRGHKWLRSLIAGWQRLDQLFPRLQQAFQARYEGLVEPEVLAVADRLADDIGVWLRTLRDPRCLWHGDFRPDNMLFGARNGEVPLAVLDWQTVSLGPGGIDASYLLGGSLETDDRRRCEADLLGHYHAALLAYGVDGYSWDLCWQEHQLNAVAGFLVALQSLLGLKRSERGERLLLTMLRRHGRHMLDLDSLPLLRSRRLEG